jgi:hypothetical protein
LRYQLKRFRQEHKPLENRDDPTTVRKNGQTFRETYGMLPAELQPEWLNGLGAKKK